MLLKECLENFCALGKIVRGETPHIHGAQGFGLQFHVVFSVHGIVAVYLAVCLAGNLQVLGNVCQVALGVIGADTA